MNAKPENTAVITIGAYPVEKLGCLSPFLRTATWKGITPIITMLGEPYSNYYELKISRLLPILKGLPRKYTHILYVDGSDVIVQGSLEGICRKFNRSGELILMGAETGVAPFKVYRLHFPKSPTPYRYPNAGVWMGERRIVIEMMEMAERIRLLHPNDLPVPPRKGMTLFNHDQGMWHYMYMNGLIELGLDREAQLVLNTCAVTKHDVIWHTNAIFDARTKTMPELLHFSTGHRQWLGTYYRYLARVHRINVLEPYTYEDIKKFAL